MKVFNLILGIILLLSAYVCPITFCFANLMTKDNMILFLVASIIQIVGAGYCFKNGLDG